MRRFENRVILVTGAASGIGAACVRRLLDEGASVAAADVKTGELEKLAQPKLLIKSVDVSDRNAASRFVAAAREKFGTLNGLINCAGIRGVGSVLDVSEETWNKVLGINLEGTVHMTQAFAQAVKDDKTPRAVVNISSGAGVLGVANRLPYVASKFAICGITKAMAPELGPFGIRVNCVAPGVTNTPLMEFLFKDPEAVKRSLARHPIGRLGEPEEVATVIVFLLTDDASYMTGAVVSVDGGETAIL